MKKEFLNGMIQILNLPSLANIQNFRGTISHFHNMEEITNINEYKTMLKLSSNTTGAEKSASNIKLETTSGYGGHIGGYLKHDNKKILD